MKRELLFIVDSFVELIEHDIKELEKIYKITWLNDQVRQNTIDQVISGGNRKENYRRTFKNIVIRISKEYGHILENDKKIVKEEPAGAGQIMTITCKIKIKEKRIKKKSYEVSEVTIQEYYINPETLTQRYS